MKGHGAKFGRKKEEAIAALLSSKSIEDAARAIGSFGKRTAKLGAKGCNNPSRGCNRRPALPPLQF
jgi:hypothetical protein